MKNQIPVRFSCRYFSIAPSTYYQWAKSKELLSFKKKKQICSQIKEIFYLSKKTYGSPRVHKELISQGITISKTTVEKYMKEMGLDARLKNKFKVQTTNSNHQNPVAQRLFKTEDKLVPDAPGKILAGDITYLRIGDKFIYLAVVLDLFNREVVGWSMGNSLETSLVLNALDAAIKKVGPDTEAIFHSDRGSQYASEAYRKFLNNKNIKPSMSRKGNCYDNAYVESWFASLKKEWIYRNQYTTEVELRALVFEYIEIWYNRKRKHSSLGHLSPMEYKLGKIV